MSSTATGTGLSHHGADDDDHQSHGGQPSARHVCHCGKAFIRKEHLRRHQATHGERTFVCPVCHRSFTRNDLLRRHLSRHDMTTAPDSRRGRACDACHANKTKCDGGPRCSLCAKRNVDCTYKHVQEGNKPNASAPVIDCPIKSILDIRIPSCSPNPEPKDGEDIDNSPKIGKDNDHQQLSPTRLTIELQLLAQPGDTPLAVLTRLAKYLDTPSASIETGFNWTESQRSWFLASIGNYFERFHEAWPIIHGPTFCIDDQPVAIVATVVMIGVWLQRSEELDDTTLRLHESLMDRFFDILTHPKPRLQKDRPWPVEIYQAMALNIIMAFCHGSERLIARAVVLQGMLIATLRESEFFMSEMASCQQKTFNPGTFLPYVQTYRERWRRLVIGLYKIDTYLSITREQAPSLHREELDVTLTSTFALWNSWGLDIFFKRVPNEPSDRAGYKFSEIASNPRSPARPLLLIEDIQVGICGLTPAIWNHTQICRRGTRAGPSGLDSTASLAWQLESWKGELDRVSKACNQQYVEDKTNEFPFMAYFGKENKDLSLWKATAMENIKCLVANTLTLYHLQAIKIYTDTRSINILAKYTEEQPENDPCSPPMIQKHQARLQSWINTPESRNALLHAIDVLRARECNMEQERPSICSLEPIAPAAIAMSSLVVWAWLMYADSPCSCVPGLNHVDIGAKSPNLEKTTQLKTWMEFGGTIALNGIAFCRCVVDGWMARFAAGLPPGRRRWDMSYQIAPILRPYQKD